MSERDIVERLREKALEPTEIVMKQWDQIRHQVEVLPGASLPRDSFEALVDWLVGDCSEAAAEILRLRAELSARAVPDEEVAKELGGDEFADETIKRLRAAGFTVIRTEARDGTD